MTEQARDLEAELACALALQRATSDMLHLIRAHPGDLTTVLNGILAKAAELCDGEAGSITMIEGDLQRFMASHGPAMAPYLGATVPLPVNVSEVVRFDDFATSMRSRPASVEMARVARVRSYASAPLTDDGRVVGSLHMYRHEVRPFRDAEVAALTSFADQASLAIGNARSKRPGLAFTIEPS